MSEKLKGTLIKLVGNHNISTPESRLGMAIAVHTLVESECALRVGMALRAAAKHAASDYNGGEYDWACACGAVGHWQNGATDTWEAHILSLDPVSVAALDAYDKEIIEKFVASIRSSPEDMKRHDAKVERKARMDALKALQSVQRTVEFYMKREIESPSNHQEFAREAQEKLDAFRAAIRSLDPAYVTALDPSSSDVSSDAGKSKQEASLADKSVLGIAGGSGELTSIEQALIVASSDIEERAVHDAEVIRKYIAENIPREDGSIHIFSDKSITERDAEVERTAREVANEYWRKRIAEDLEIASKSVVKARKEGRDQAFDAAVEQVMKELEHSKHTMDDPSARQDACSHAIARIVDKRKVLDVASELSHPAAESQAK